MRSPSPALTATLRALCGDDDLHVIAPALCKPQFARILALAPDVDSIIGALGALAGGLPNLLTPAMCASSALHAAIASWIGTDAGVAILGEWAKVAPVGWGTSFAAALINAVRHNRCAPWAAAALLGPSDSSATLLIQTGDIAHAVQRWGQTTPDNPTAWMESLSLTERKRLLHALSAKPFIAASCLPWLPAEHAEEIAELAAQDRCTAVLEAYALASPATCASHATILSALIQRAERHDLGALTRLAVASCMDGVWTEVARLLNLNPDVAGLIVTAAPWHVLRPDVQEGLLSAAESHDVCAAIAFARGVRPDPPTMTWKTARVFFAAATREVWDVLPKEMQRMWSRCIDMWYASLAIRSIGPDPTFLAQAYLDDTLIATVRRHLHDDATVQRTLLPIAVRNLPIAAVPAIVAALPAPLDPATFVQIANGARTMPQALHDWITAHPTPQAWGAAITLLHAATQRGVLTERCDALAHALDGWSWTETNALLMALPDDARTTLRPSSNTLADALAHSNQQDAFRQTLSDLVALPPSIAIPALHVLDTLAQATTPPEQRHAGEGVATVLRHHGRIFTDIARALNDDARSAVLPRPDLLHDGLAIDDLAVADPLVAHYLAYALHAHDPIAARDALTAASLDETKRLWRLLPETLRHAVLGDHNTLASAAAAPGCADNLAQALRAWGADVSLLSLALRMLIDDDETRRTWGAAILAHHPDLAASLLPLLNTDVCARLACNVHVALAGADLPPLRPSTLVQRRRR
jgi:hypothetical protein